MYDFSNKTIGIGTALARELGRRKEVLK